jgi:hypothetical protein
MIYEFAMNSLLDIENDQVRFQWKDYRNGDQVTTMTLSADEFIRRFLLHVLPNGFQRIGYYGFLGNRYRQEKLDQCRRLLGMPPPSPHPAPKTSPVVRCGSVRNASAAVWCWSRYCQNPRTIPR